MSDGDAAGSPNPAGVTDQESLARELERLRVRAAHGTGTIRVPLSAIARNIGMNPTQKSTLSNYFAGKTLPPSDLLDQIVIALGARPDEQRLWSEAWYRVSESRWSGPVGESIHPTDHNPVVQISRHEDGAPELQLAMPPAAVSPVPAKGPNLNAADALDNWLDDETSNLAIVMGDFGSGKTTTLEDFLKRHATGKHRPHYSRYADIRVDDLTVSRPDGSYHLLMIDDFDAFNTVSGNQVPPPDLRELVDPLRDVDKIIVATRRTSRHRQDELVRQLERPRRYDRFQVRRPTIIELQPYPEKILMQIGEALQNQAFQDFFQLLAPGGRLASRQLRNPLFLTSMVKESDRLRAGETWSIAQLYEEYIENVLTEDFDRRRSRIVEPQKRAILAGMADQIFVTAEHEPESGNSTQRGVPYDQVAALVMAEIGPSHAGGSRNHANYDWTRDFLATTHLVVERSPDGMLPLRPEFDFVHQSFYDLFLARALIARIAREELPGLNPEQLRPRLYESLTPYFMRDFLGGPIGSAIVRMARLRNLPSTDRLLLLYLLEDDSQFAMLLESAPREYIVQLERWFQNSESLFLRKVIMYQLVVLGRRSAFDYVDLAAADEEHYDVFRENLTLMGDVTVTQFQLSRLANHALAAAIPIAVYRLGQFGDDSAVEELRRLPVGNEQRLRALIDEAILQINLRTTQRASERSFDE
jgi:hypothetical protein